mgnify:CR=1 FL=1
MSEVYDATRCELGEGPLWHPGRGELLWFDILAARLYRRAGDQLITTQFDELCSAAGWVDDTRLLIASETRLFLFDMETEAREDIAPLEADTPDTRSNDGRADPWGGFWIGTMGKGAAPGAGAIYRYYNGELRRLHPGITIPNAICFAPDKSCAYFADTISGQIMRQPLNANDGWPSAAAEVFVDLRAEGLNPDGAVTDAAGNLWNAQWGAWRVACYAPDGSFLKAIPFDAAHTSCPAFGGADLTTLFCTTARENLDTVDADKSDHHGKVLAATSAGQGHPEPRVIL